MWSNLRKDSSGRLVIRTLTHLGRSGKLSAINFTMSLLSSVALSSKPSITIKQCSTSNSSSGFCKYIWKASFRLSALCGLFNWSRSFSLKPTIFWHIWLARDCSIIIGSFKFEVLKSQKWHAANLPSFSKISQTFAANTLLPNPGPAVNSNNLDSSSSANQL